MCRCPAGATPLLVKAFITGYPACPGKMHELANFLREYKQQCGLTVIEADHEHIPTQNYP